MKKGIALIELVFAIVIIAITLLSVPNLISTTTKASSQAITQEAISNAASHIDMIMSQFWDENATNPKYNNPILVVDSTTPGLSEAPFMPGFGGVSFSYARRIGSAISTSRRFAVDINGTKLTASSILKKEEPSSELPDDVDDFEDSNYTLVLRENTTSQEGDYKDISIDIKTKIYYISDSPTNLPPTYNRNTIYFSNPFNSSKIRTTSTNIKSIIVTLKSAKDPDKKIVLKAFSCNIGSSKLKERKF